MADIMQFMKARLEKEQADTLVNYQALNQVAKKQQILFTGSSLMEQFPILELASADNLPYQVYNRGVGGFETTDFLAHLDTVLLDLSPRKVFINIGTNDLRLYEDGRQWQDVLRANYDEILARCHKALPETIVYVMAYYPMDETNEVFKEIAEVTGAVRRRETLLEANQIVEDLARKYQYHFINVNAGLTNDLGQLKPELSKDGIHLYAKAYQLVYAQLRPYLICD